MGLGFKHNIQALVPVEPTDIAKVYLEVVLSHWVIDTNGMEDGVRSINLDKVDPRSNSDSKLRFGLEFRALKADIYAPQIGNVATVTIWYLGDKSTSCHLSIVIKA